MAEAIDIKLGSLIINETTEQQIANNEITIEPNQIYLTPDDTLDNVAFTDTNNNFTTDQDIDGNVGITGNLDVGGNLTIRGQALETHIEQIHSKSDYIYMREDAVNGLLANEYSGLEFIKYNGTDNLLVVVDKNGLLKVGDKGTTLQTVVTRADIMADGNYVKWDGTNQQLITYNLDDDLEDYFSKTNPQEPYYSKTSNTIPSGSDLNNYTTPGVYVSVDSDHTLIHKPSDCESGAGKLIVYTTTYSSSYINQEWQQVASTNRWIRCSNADSGTRVWSDWVLFGSGANDDYLPLAGGTMSGDITFNEQLQGIRFKYGNFNDLLLAVNSMTAFIGSYSKPNLIRGSKFQFTTTGSNVGSTNELWSINVGGGSKQLLVMNGYGQLTLNGNDASSNMTFNRADGSTYATFNTRNMNGIFELYADGITANPTVELNALSTSLSKIPNLNTILTDGSTIKLQVSTDNEINFASNSTSIYFGYNNRLNSPRLIDTYKFGTHSGSAGASNGNIECGTVKIGSCKASYNSTTKALEFSFV